ncbi:glycosyltransferase family 2 protein [Niveispirillum fermenti]|uniref:glycosyltransferase family 2 protein n=1 Tax=Niveispirillum fermenti TaxID=1233113 RepID=UPI003A8B376A
MSGDIPATVIVMTRNEAANITACLACLDRFAQVLVVDSHSEDGTDSLAKAAGAEILPFRWNGLYPKKKQWSLSHPRVRHDWVLFIDADERVPPALAEEIAVLLRGESRHDAFFIDSRPVWLGRTLRFGTPYRKIALLRRDRVRFPTCDDLHITRMWEVEGHYQPVADGSVGRLCAFMLHDDAKPPAAWFDRHNRYSDWEAGLSRYAARGQQVRLAGERGWRRRAKHLVASLPCRPLLAFLHAYIWCLGFLDGRAGLHHALARAFYYWSIDLKRDWLATRDAASQMDRSGAGDRYDQPALVLSVASPARVLTSSNVRRRMDSSGIR